MNNESANVHRPLNTCSATKRHVYDDYQSLFAEKVSKKKLHNVAFFFIICKYSDFLIAMQSVMKKGIIFQMHTLLRISFQDNLVSCNKK